MSDNRGFLFCGVFVLILGLAGCAAPEKHNLNTDLGEVAGSAEALDFMKTFDGRGALSDSSQPTPPGEALKTFRYPDDLALDLVLSEPEITQPVHISFDHRGRLWVVQYKQYPYPKGLRVLSMDQHIRAQYDRVPEPPPQGVRGADRITFFEDSDGDGSFDKQTDAITGLNIATAVVLGRGKIWVLDPPYLLAYGDGDNNGKPEGDPEIHLRGFGIEDTHAVANNLRWGPDGWLYGAQGSTCTANVSSSVTRNIRFDGQAIWRYHPGTQVFELFAEGGGNTFDVEIDDKGRLYSGDNGVTRGRYYKQGAYYLRNMGKHGAFTNPYAFGHLRDMELTGDKRRFTHAFVRYQESGLPERYHDRMISINPLQRYLQLSRFEVDGSSFRIEDERRVLETGDYWFRPVDITTGPDGAVYVADWYDSRLSHVDPRDTWSKTTGRVYRLRNRNAEGLFPAFDISEAPNEKLIELLSDRSRWFRQQALLEIGNRGDKSLLPVLGKMLASGKGQTALEALWAINLVGGFSDSLALAALGHDDPFVRMWAVRLLGDANEVTPEVSGALSALASAENHPEVRSQLAATAKRLPGSSGISIARNLLKGNRDAGDPDIALQLWWALESKAVSDRDAVADLFDDRTVWNNPIVVNTILARLMQRWMMEGGDPDYSACARLLRSAPSPAQAKPLIDGMQEALRGRDISGLSGELVDALRPFQSRFRNESLALALRRGDQKETEKALDIIADQGAETGLRLSYIRIFGDISEPGAVPVLLRLLEGNQSPEAVKQAALEALARYADADIGARVTKAYPDYLRFDPRVRYAALSLLAQRENWAEHLLNAIDRKKQPGENFIAHTIDKGDVPESVAQQLFLLDNLAIKETVRKLWPGVVPASASEKTNRIAQVQGILKAGSGDPSNGRLLFNSRCAACHRLFSEGTAVGPDLTGYDRRNISDLLTNIIDPSAYIREGYVIYHLTTTDKRSITGTLMAQNGSTVTILPFGSAAVTLNTDQVAEMVGQKVSLMPEGLLNGMDDQQIRDLVAYLTLDAD